jgi:hypothetical protein
MPTIRTDGAPEWFEVVYDEWPTPEAARSLLHDLLLAGQLTEKTTALIDLRLVKQLPKQDQVRRTVEAVSSQNHWPLRRAYVVMPGAQYGVLRQLQAQMPEDIETEIFTDEGAAREWCEHH